MPDRWGILAADCKFINLVGFLEIAKKAVII